MSRKDFVPRPYQTLILKHFIDEDRNGVFAGMGLGKTVATLTYIKYLFDFEVTDKPVLILAPLRVAESVWPAECREWNHLKNLSVQPITGSLKHRILALKAKSRIYSMNYENIEWLVNYYEDPGREWPFETVILDESTKVKNFRTRQGGKRAKALGSIIHRKVKRVKELTGTPTPNGLKDLWGQAWMLDAGQRLEKSFNKFSLRWFRVGYDGFSLKPLPKADQEIHHLLRDLYFTVDTKDYFDLKDPIVNNIVVDLPAAAMTKYKELETQFFTVLEGEYAKTHTIEAANAAVLSQKLLQVSSGCMYVGENKWEQLHDEKIKALESIIEEASGAPVLVAYYYVFDEHRILEKFKSKGAVSLKRDSTAIDRWNKGQIPILLVHPSSAGHGLNLQHGGNIMVFFGVDWNLETRLQAVERIGPVRQMQSGYKRNVFIHNILSNTWIDRAVAENIEGKKSIQDLLLEAMKSKKVVDK